MTTFDKHYKSADPIAVIGMACRFPKAENLEAYWQILRTGKSCASEFTEEELLAAGVKPETIAQDDFVARAAVVERPEYFDAELFGYSRQEAESIDPQQRLFLQVVWHAIEHAGYAPKAISHKTGVYGAARMSTYASLDNFSVTDIGQVKGMQALLGNDKDYLATRVAYRLNLKGPALTIQTACSSSLVAVHMACESLRSGECYMTIAGGAAISFPQNAGYRYQQGMVFSPDGFCRPFSDQAQGTFGGNGVGAVVLKRLEDALNDGDPVMAVIRGSAINNDGHDKVGFTAPSMQGQQHVLQEALQLADTNPADVSMIEAHGTATTLGDPIEIMALQKAYRHQQDDSLQSSDTPPCLIGSVKSNLGHLDTAAGIASLIKTVLSVYHAEIPQSLHVDRVNPDLKLNSHYFAIARENTPWVNSVRTAGVSSFGIGGTNCHMIVESLPEVLRNNSDSNSGDADLGCVPSLLLSAASEYSLQQLAVAYGTRLHNQPEQLENLAYTALHGRHLDLPYRLAVSLDSKAAALLISASSSVPIKSNASVVTGVSKGNPKQVWLFTGQGSQYHNMGAELYNQSTVFANSINRSAKVAKPLLGYDIRQVMFSENSSLWDDPTCIQVVIVAFDIAIAAHWQALGLQPDYVLGHSLGEYAAAVVSGMLEQDAVIALIVKRGQYVDQCIAQYPDSNMLAVFANPEDIDQVTALKTLDLAAINGRNHRVYSGLKTEIEAAIGGLKKLELAYQVLDVPCAMHSKVLDSIVDSYGDCAAELQVSKGYIPLVSSLTGKVLTLVDLDSNDKRASYWRNHLRQTVNFQSALAYVIDQGVSVCVEMGPQSHLINMGKRDYSQPFNSQPFNSEPINWVSTASPTTSAAVMQDTALRHLYIAGCKLDWQGLISQSGRKCYAPLYPFDESYYWHQSDRTMPANLAKSSIDVNVTQLAGKMIATSSNLSALLKRITNTESIVQQQQLLSQDYQQLHGFIKSCVGEAITTGFSVGDWIRGGRLLPRYRDTLVQLLEQSVLLGLYSKQGEYYFIQKNTTDLSLDINTDFGLLNKSLFKEYCLPPIHDQAIHVKTCEQTRYYWDYEKIILPATKNITVNSLILLGKAAACQPFLQAEGIELSHNATTGVITIPEGELLSSTNDLLTEVRSIIDSQSRYQHLIIVTHGAYPLKVQKGFIPSQYAIAAFIRCLTTELPHCQVLNLDVEVFDVELISQAIASLLPMLSSKKTPREIIYREGEYYQCRLAQLNDLSDKLVNLPLVLPLKRHYYHVVTGGMGGIGRLCIHWLAQQGVKYIGVLTRHSSHNKHSGWQVFVDKIQQNFGCSIRKINCDVSSASDLDKALNTLQQEHCVSGVIHTAGVADHTDIANTDIDHLEKVVSAKALGAATISHWLENNNADYHLLFSSASVLGAPGQASYALANAYLDGLALSATARNSNVRHISISWGAWQQVGMTRSNELINKLASDGMYTLEPEEGLWHIEQALAQAFDHTSSIPCTHQFAMRVDTSSPIFGDYFCNLSSAPSRPLGDDPHINVLDLHIKNNDNKPIRGDELTPQVTSIGDYVQEKTCNKAQDKTGIANWLEQRIRYQLRIEEHEELTHDQDLLTMGMDSLLFLELSTDIKRMFTIIIHADVVYENFTIAALSELIFDELQDGQELENKANKNNLLAPLPLKIDLDNRYQPFPLTPIQHAYWIGRTDLLNFGGVACQVVFEWDKSTDEFDNERFEIAWNSLIQRHDMLRMVVDTNGEQRILNDVPLYQLNRRDFSELNFNEKKTRLETLRQKLCQQVRPAQVWPLFELSITQIDATQLRLHMNLDLLQFDVQSFKIMMDDLERAYRGEDLPPLTLSFRDYVMHEEQQRETEQWQASWQYWQQLIPQLPLAPQLPLKQHFGNTSAIASHVDPAFFTLSGQLEKDRWEALKKVWQGWGITPSAGLMSLFSETLALFCRQAQFTLNMTFFNRQPVHEEVQELIGDFTSVLLMDVDTQRTQSLDDTMQRMQKKLWQHLSHSRINGVEVIRAFSRHLQEHQQVNSATISEKNKEQPAITPVVFTSMLGMSMEGMDIEQALTRFLGDPVFVHSQTPQVWLDHQIMEVNGQLSFNWYCMKGILADGILDSLFTCYQNLLDKVAHNPQLMTEDKITLFNSPEFQSRVTALSALPAIDNMSWPEKVAFEQSLCTLSAVELAKYYPPLTHDDTPTIAVVADQHRPHQREIIDVSRVVELLPSASILSHLSQSWDVIEKQALISLCHTLQQYDVFVEEGKSYNLEVIVMAVQPAPQFVRLLEQWLEMLCRESLIDQHDNQFTANQRLFELVSKKISAEVLSQVWCQDIYHYLQQSVQQHHDLLKGKISALEILFGEYNYTDSLYANNPSLLFLNNNAAAIINALGNNKPANGEFRVLEVGAGTAATSKTILRDAADTIDHYHFSDISNAFLDQAKKTLNDYRQKLHFMLFDINQVINFKEHPVGGYNVIIAVNVLHDAHHIDHCLNRLRKLLVPGGYLLLIEATDRYSAMQLATVGFIEGLNAFDDFRVLDNNAMLDVPMWNKALETAGFKMASQLPQQISSPLRQHLFLAQARTGGCLSIPEVTHAITNLNTCPDTVKTQDLSNTLSVIQYERLPHSHPSTASKVTDNKDSTTSKSVNKNTMPSVNQAMELTVASVWQTFLQQPVNSDTDFFISGGDSLLATRMIVELQKQGIVQANLQPLFEHPVLRDFCSALEILADNHQNQQCDTSSQSLENTIPIDKNNNQNMDSHELGQQLQRFSLTDLQRAYWLGESSFFELSSGIAHFYAELTINALDITQFMQAWNAIVKQHPQLQGYISDGEFVLLPQVENYQPIIIDLQHMSSKEATKKIEQARTDIRRYGVPTDQWPLFSIHIYQLANDEYIIHFVFDLVMADGASLTIIFQQLEDYYLSTNLEQHLLNQREVLKNTYTVADYMQALVSHEQSNKYIKSRDYWLARIDQLPDAPKLPMAQENSSKVMNLNIFSRIINAQQWQIIQQQAFAKNLTPSTVMLTVFGRILAQFSESQHFCINVLHANRNLDLGLPKDQTLVANLSTTNMLEMNFTLGESLLDSAKHIQDQLFNDLQHADFNGQQVMREKNQRQHNLSAAMPIVFNDTVSVSQRKPMKIGKLNDFGAQTPHVYLDCMLIAAPNNGVEVKWAVQLDYLAEGVMQNMFDGFFAQLKSLIDHANSWEKPWVLPLSETQQTQLDIVNNTHISLENLQPDESEKKLITLCDMIEHGVIHYAERIAVVTREGSLTYQQVWSQAQRLAIALIESEAEAEDKDKDESTLVAIVMHKGWEQVIAVVAIHLASKAYLPIDASYPQQRIDELLVLGEVSQVITQTELDNTLDWPDNIHALTTLSFDEITRESPPVLSKKQQKMLTNIRPKPEDIAYVIFTSGSTGVPKGVVISHKSAVNTLLDINQKLSLNENDVVLAISSLSFDLSVFDIFSTLMAGAKIVIPETKAIRDPMALIDWVVQEKVTIWNSVPAFVQMLQDYMHYRQLNSAMIMSLRWIMMSGDWIPLSLYEQVNVLHGSVNMMSLGGATEAAIWSIYHVMGERTEQSKAIQSLSSVPYGKPLANQAFTICNDLMDPCPIWVAGDLYIRGSGLAEGYWKDKDKTNAAFIAHPYSGERLYKTGDLGRYLPDGTIEFLGRNDQQVKINGYRVELGEIEAALSSHSTIKEVLVHNVSMVDSTQVLVAYIMGASDEIQENNWTLLRQYISNILPVYMCPQHYMALDCIPHTANGKVDRKALPKPETEQNRSISTDGSALSQTEKRLMQLWQDILNTISIERHDSFFDVGGQSLLAVQLIARISHHWQCDISAGTLQHHDTIASLATYLDENIQKNESTSLVPLKAVELKEKNNKKTVFIVHPIGGHLLSYQHLSKAWPENSDLFGLEFPREFLQRDQWTVVELAAYYRELILQHQPNGSYIVAGWSFGGIVAYEISQQLTRLNFKVEQCLLIDSFVPVPRKDLVLDTQAYLQHFLIDFIGRFPALTFDNALSLETEESFLSHLHNILKEHSDFVGLQQQDLASVLAIYRASLHAMLNYTVTNNHQNFSLTLLMATEKYHTDFMSYLDPIIQHDKTQGWEQYAQVTHRELTGDHYTILDKDHVSTLVIEVESLLFEQTQTVESDIAITPREILPEIVK